MGIQRRTLGAKISRIDRLCKLLPGKIKGIFLFSSGV